MPQIPALPAASTLDGADQVPIQDVSASSTKKFTLTKLKEWLQSLAGWVSFLNIIAEPYTAWTPGIYQNNQSTALTSTIRVAKYTQVGSLVSGQLTVDTIGNPGGANIWFDLPVDAVGIASIDVMIGAPWTNSNGTLGTGNAGLVQGNPAAKAYVRLPANGAWAASTGNAFSLQFSYEAAPV